MTIEEIEARRAEIASEAETADSARLGELENEVRSLNEQAEQIRKDAETRQRLRAGIASGTTPATVIRSKVFTEAAKPDEPKVEVRNTKAYIDAFAKYIKTEDDTECRALLSTNGTNASAGLTGYVPVPDFVAEEVKTAWERSELMSLVRKTYLKGNIKVAFELSATGAVVHKEGTAAPNEETITLGIVTLIPQSIKKWITVSDEAFDVGLGGSEAFLRYIYDEITYRIAKEAEKQLITLINALPDTPTSTSVSAQVVTGAPAVGLVAEAMGVNKGRDLTITMNRATWAMFKAAQYEANYAIDPFENLRIVFSEELPAYSTADEGDVYMIVGDFANGAQANFPNGDVINVKVDNLSLAEKDLVKFVGREYVGLGIVGMDMFTLVEKPSNP